MAVPVRVESYGRNFLIACARRYTKMVPEYGPRLVMSSIYTSRRARKNLWFCQLISGEKRYREWSEYPHLP